MFAKIYGDNDSVDINSRQTVFSMFLVGVIAPEVFIVQPGFVQGLVELLGFDDRGAGYTASAEMWGLAATTILMTFIAHRVNWRSVIFWSLIVMFVANILCMMTSDLNVFVALRFVAGLGAGSLVSLSFAAIGLTKNPDRNFGFLIMWVLTYGAVVLWAMPSVYELAGMNGALFFFALFPLSAVPFIKHMPVTGENVVQVEEDAVNLSGRLKALALFAMLAYFMAQGVVWAYLFLIGSIGRTDRSAGRQWPDAVTVCGHSRRAPCRDDCSSNRQVHTACHWNPGWVVVPVLPGGHIRVRHVRDSGWRLQLPLEHDASVSVGCNGQFRPARSSCCLCSCDANAWPGHRAGVGSISYFGK